MLRASSHRHLGTSIMTHRQFLASLLLAATVAAPAQAAVTDASLDAATAAVMPQVINWRRDFHQNPELSNREFRTSKIVADQLRQMGIEVQTGIAHTGVVGILRGGKPGPTIALRSDMDALPVTEQGNLACLVANSSAALIAFGPTDRLPLKPSRPLGRRIERDANKAAILQQFDPRQRRT